MPLRHNRFMIGGALAGMASLSLVLAGCNKAGDDTGNTSAEALPALPATLPMTNSPSQPTTLAPRPSAIPTRTIRTARVSDPRAAYAYADQAGYFSQSLGNGPPDYGFDYEGVRPWAWQGYDGSRVFLEPVDGGYRYYYYRAGSDRPYFVRDPQFAYGYDGDQLAAIYGPDGALVPYDDYGPRAGYAAAYLWRAERLVEASRDRQAISAEAWAGRQDSIAASRERWASNRDRQAEWAAYHAEEAAQQSRYWAEEAARRDADAQRFSEWHQQDFRTPPPPRAIPPRWQQASWAHDSARYAPIAAAAVGAAALVVAHNRQGAVARQDASRPQASAAAPLQPTTVQPLARPADRSGPEARGVPGRPPAAPPRLAGSPTPLSGHGASAQANRSWPRQSSDRPDQRPSAAVSSTLSHDAQSRPKDVSGQPITRQPEQSVTVHYGSRTASRAAAPTPRAEERHGEPPHAPTPNSSELRQAGAPTHPPAAQPHTAEAAPHGGGGDHQGGGHADGGHHAGGDHGDHHH